MSKMLLRFELTVSQIHWRTHVDVQNHLVGALQEGQKSNREMNERRHCIVLILTAKCGSSAWRGSLLLLALALALRNGASLLLRVQAWNSNVHTVRKHCITGPAVR